MLYKIEIKNNSNEVIADLSSRYLTLSYEKTKNRPSYASLSFELYDIEQFCASSFITVPQLFMVNANQVFIYRNNTLIFSGEIYYYQAKLLDTPTIEIKAQSVLAVLKQRFTTGSQLANEEIFTGVDAGQIAKKLIDDTQARVNGDLGITAGTIQASVNRDRNYFIKNIYDAIVQLSEVENGFDFEITPTKVFNVYYPRQGQIKNNLILTYPGNIVSMSVERDGQNYANAIYASGFGTGTDRLQTYYDDPTVQNVYGIREKEESFEDVSEFTTLQEHAEEEIRVSKSFKPILAITLDGKDPVFNSCNIGDTVNIQVADYYTSCSIIGKAVRIEAINVSVDENDAEVVQLGVVSV